MADSFLHGVEVIELDGGARPIQTTASSVIGLVGTAPKGPVNTPTLILGSRSEAIEVFGEDTDGYTIPAALSAIFDQTGAMVVVVNVADPENEDFQDEDYKFDVSKITLSDVVGGTNPDGTYRGAKCLLAAQTECKVTPRILIAPGFTHETSSNESLLVGELKNIAERMRATVIADCPNETKEVALAFVENINSDRVYCVYPWAKVFKNNKTIEEPLSARIAGLIANSDNERGFWWSPSNREINGIVGLSKPIDFAMGDSTCIANFLNEKKIATIIQQDGFRLWGNRTTASNTKWQFLSVRRTADLINDSLARAHMWAVDRNITRTYVEDVIEGVNNYMRYLKNIGAIIGGTCWADSSLNTPENIQLGKIIFDFDFTPPYPAEHITFRSRMVNNYLNEIFE
jgi:phage tail sheath protein FI